MVPAVRRRWSDIAGLAAVFYLCSPVPSAVGAAFRRHLDALSAPRAMCAAAHVREEATTVPNGRRLDV